jgi:hypothetical protein
MRRPQRPGFRKMDNTGSPEPDEEMEIIDA